MQVPVLKECSLCLQKASARWECHGGSQPRTESKAGITEHRQREIILQLLLWPGNLKRFLPGTGSLVLCFYFYLCISDLSDVSGTLSWYTVQAGGIPVGNYVCLRVYSRKSLTLDKQGQCFDFRVCLILCLCHSSHLVGVRVLSLAHGTCSFARYSANVYT